MTALIDTEAMKLWKLHQQFYTFFLFSVFLPDLRYSSGLCPDRYINENQLLNFFVFQMSEVQSVVKYNKKKMLIRMLREISYSDSF